MTDEMKDIVFFGRAAISKPNSTATLFVLEGNSHARRVTVRYGVISGQLIQVLDGLVLGERVIVTDMSKWTNFARVRLE
jgi:HlyD family secretion protein